LFGHCQNLIRPNKTTSKTPKQNMPQFIFYCATCDSQWRSFSPRESERRSCRDCRTTIFGQRVLTVPPGPPVTAVTKPVPPQSSRRWESVKTAGPKPQDPEPSIAKPAQEPPVKAAEQVQAAPPVVDVVEKTEPISATISEATLSPLASDSGSQSETKKQREYIPAAERPENRLPKPRFFRFFALNSLGGPGIAGAIADTRSEAIDRIVVRFLENLAIHSNRNQNITQVFARFPLLQQAQTQSQFLATLQRYGMTEDSYQQLIGPTPLDTLGGWNAHLQNTGFGAGQAGYQLSKQLESELNNATYVEYPLENCAFYVGGPVSFP
jgi:hypothetical protein